LCQGQVIWICGEQSCTGAIFLEYFGFPCQSFHWLRRTHHYPSSGAGTVSQIVADVPSGLSLTLPKKLKKLKKLLLSWSLLLMLSCF
jgi:hypothetical protein